MRLAGPPWRLPVSVSYKISNVDICTLHHGLAPVSFLAASHHCGHSVFERVSKALASGNSMIGFEDLIRALTVPRDGSYPRPWTTETDPTQADVLIVGASSAKTFHVADVGSHDQFLDALWNRNGLTCRAMYDAATAKPSPTRTNLDRLSQMLAANGLTSLQTNVTCASARYDAEVSKTDRAHGTLLFKAVVTHLPWSAMIIYGVGATDRFGKALGLAMPKVPSPDTAPVSRMIYDRPVFVSPTLASPSYRTSVWPYLERVVMAIGGRLR